MAYFPNGSSGDKYMEQYCEYCLNWQDKEDGRGYGCPIWDAHLITNYSNNEGVKEVLEILIPTKKDKIFPDKCSMFRDNGECRGQLRMEFTNGNEC